MATNVCLDLQRNSHSSLKKFVEHGREARGLDDANAERVWSDPTMGSKDSLAQFIRHIRDAEQDTE